MALMVVSLPRRDPLPCAATRKPARAACEPGTVRSPRAPLTVVTAAALLTGCAQERPEPAAVAVAPASTSGPTLTLTTPARAPSPSSVPPAPSPTPVVAAGDGR